MKASMCTRSMSKRLNVDALPGASVGFVGEEIIAARSDLRDYQGWQVRAPRAATCMPDQPVECWLVGGREMPGADGVMVYVEYARGRVHGGALRVELGRAPGRLGGDVAT